MVLRTVQDVDDGHLVRLDAVEDQVAAMAPSPDSGALVARNQGEALGHVGQAKAFAAQLLDEAERTRRIVAGM